MDISDQIRALPYLPVLTSVNQKGGVGKTETILLLAEWFALVRKLRVLIMDTDMQCNASDHCVGMDIVKDAVGGQLPPKHPDFSPEENVEERSSIADLYFNKSVLPYDSWIRTDDESTGFVEVLMGHPEKLELVNTSFQRQINQPLNKTVHNSLKMFIDEKDPDTDEPILKSMYDIILIDTGPSRSPLFHSAVRAATHCIIPFKPHRRDVQGMVAMLQVLERENLQRPNDQIPINLVGLLPNMLEKPQTIAQRIYLKKAVDEHSDILFPKNTWLSKLAAFANRDLEDSNPRSIFELPDSNSAKQQATTMAKYVEQSLIGEANNG